MSTKGRTQWYQIEFKARRKIFSIHLTCQNSKMWESFLRRIMKLDCDFSNIKHTSKNKISKMKDMSKNMTNTLYSNIVRS